MGFPFLENWRARHGISRGIAVFHGRDGGDGATGGGPDAATLNELLSECELLREQAIAAGVELDDTPRSLERLDQLLPRWREDPDTASWLGNDAGLYLGTVIVQRIARAAWQLWPNGHPVVLLASGRELDVVELGHAWAIEGAPELSAIYNEVSEG
ncbi:DUF6278 family protein [Phaeacidiphilus oryzae]|uniref:DUF6278 family protein n=1 Tax=Phaeacidiphilus oryzae TaxID=348818 RepID=UPI000560D29E|nr:DUF6278 family protein [Phaeacidiphilus oryzae]